MNNLIPEDDDDDTQIYKKPWVGLTAEELEPLCDLWKVTYGSVYVDEFARAIEAKLKEKNSGS